MEIDNARNTGDPRIIITLKYEYLTVGQAGQLLQSINGLYDATARALIFEGFNYIAGPDVILYPVPLTIEKADTSHSLELILSLSPDSIPSIVLEGTKLKVALPQWAAVVTAVGLLLRWSLETYDKAIEILKKNKELEKLNNELEQLKHEHSESARIQSKIHNFNEIILARNITEAYVNGELLKHRK